ncbi:MAG: hypothetical protein ISR85_03410 [Kiritimatiellales bacterium]|nr:hypothetical protein [Kiritimatiellota bacterium]MBL7011959.1 hypothetical protein [Kiritimatiellales bacterium]
MAETTCPQCRTKLQYDAGRLGPTTMIRCPACKQTFRPLLSAKSQKVRSNKLNGKIIGGVVLLGLIILGFVVSNMSSEDRPHLQKPKPIGSQWVQANYRGLVDMNQLVQSGQSISEAISDGVNSSHQKGQLQPFLDPFSSLLPHVLDVLEGGPGSFPRTSVIDELPGNVSRPAWAAILEGGRIVVTDDGNGEASVFVPGANAKKAYETSYGVIRHVLASLLPPDGQPLKVSTYAYLNNYALCELKLCPDPFVVEAVAFPGPAGKTPLDLDSLSDFFAQGYELAGGSMDAGNQLVLVGKKAGKQTLDSAPVELSDLAVAYRAVFHAGDNQAFISLDPHRNPTYVNVNFGGYLEDTRIGSVVLESDKRFKTITSGLDPTSFVDLRDTIRSHVPTFATSSERDLAQPGVGQSGWQGTRFWFYPDSVEIEASLDYRQGVIAKAQFTADAERSRDDFGSTEAFDRLKKAQLSPAIRTNINDLNQNYAQYASFFPELRELSNVARLMGLCIWLQKANLDQKLDLEELLSVELPAVHTPRTKRQLISATVFSTEKGSAPPLSDIAARAMVRYLTPLLDKTVNEVFSSDELLADFLAESSGTQDAGSPSYLYKAQTFRNLHGNERVSQLITDRQALLAFASVTAGMIDAPMPPSLLALENLIDSKSADIDRLDERLQAMKASMARASGSEYNSYVPTYNALANEINSAQTEVNRLIEQYNAKGSYSQKACEISGGIGLEPDKFKLRKTKTSPLLDQARRIVNSTDASLMWQGEQWARSTPTEVPRPRKAPQLKKGWTAEESLQTETTTRLSAASDDGAHYWRSSNSLAGSWKDLSVRAHVTTERIYDASTRQLQIANFNSGELKECIIGRYDGRSSIVFSKSPRQNISSPSQPPNWWQEQPVE